MGSTVGARGAQPEGFGASRDCGVCQATGSH